MGDQHQNLGLLVELLSIGLNSIDEGIILFRNEGKSVLLNNKLAIEIGSYNELFHATSKDPSKLMELDVKSFCDHFLHESSTSSFFSLLSAVSTLNNNQKHILLSKSQKLWETEFIKNGESCACIFRETIKEEEDTLLKIRKGLDLIPYIVTGVEYFEKEKYYIPRYTNEGYAKWTNNENIIGMILPDINSPFFEASKEFLNIFQNHGKENPIAVRRGTRAFSDGTSGFIKTTVRYVGESRNGNKLFLNISDDLLFRREQEHQLDSLMTSLFEKSPIGTALLEINSNGQIYAKLANPAFKIIHNINKLESHSEEGIDWIIFDFDKSFVELVKDAMELAKNDKKVVMVDIQNSSTHQWIRVSVSQFKSEMYCYNAIDITEMKSILQLYQAKTEFLGTMSHEIRTPLFGIIGSLDLISKNHINDEIAEIIRIGKVCSEQLLTVINDILDYSKLEDDMIVLECVPFSFQQVIQDSMEIVSVAAEQKKIELMYDIFSSIPSNSKISIDNSQFTNCQIMKNQGNFIQPDIIHGDPMRVRQILVNLLSNAVKFSSNGTVIIIRVALYKNTNDIENENYLLHLSVEDFGIGIEQEVIGRLFKPFVQADTSTTRQYGGSGLGLSISQKLVHKMNGKMWCTSKLGIGSIFNVVFATKISEFFKIEIPSDLVHSSIRLFSPSNRKKRVLLPSNIKPNTILIMSDIKRSLSSQSLSATLLHCGFNVMEVDLESANQILQQQNYSNCNIIAFFYNISSVKGSANEFLSFSQNDGLSIVKILEDLRIFLVVVCGSTISTALNILRKQIKVTNFICIQKPVSGERLENCFHLIHKTFAFYIPDKSYLDNLSDLPLDSSNKKNEGLSSLEILVAEDNILNQRILKRLLQLIEIDKVTFVCNGIEAVEAVKLSRYDIVLMDVMMPILGGIEATIMVRSNSSLQQPIILGLTADAFKENKEKCEKAGMNGFLTKPISLEELKSAFMKYSSSQHTN